MKIAVVYFKKDYEKAKIVAEHLKCEMVEYKDGIFEDIFGKYDVIVAIIACGIVVRKIAPLLRDKFTDPAVVVLDKNLRFAVPLIGGHKGANRVANMLAKYGFIPVITTEAEVKDGYCVGIGSRKGVKKEDVLNAIHNALKEIGADINDVRLFATVSIKKNEKGIIEAVKELKKPLLFVDVEDINSMNFTSIKETKAKIIGIKNVSEACALYYSKNRKLVLPKKIYKNVTVAIAL